MDKGSVGIQYIICECGDNFPNEKLLNSHLAKGHGDLEVLQCESCPEIFTSEKLFQQHQNEHEIQKVQEKLAKIQSQKYIRKLTLQNATKQEQPEEFTMEVLQHSNAHHKKPKPKESHRQLKASFTKELTAKKAIKSEAKKSPPVIKVNNLKRIDSINLIQGLRGYGGLVKVQSPLSPEKMLPRVEVEPVPDMETEVMESVAEEMVVVKSEMEQADVKEEDIQEEIYYQCDVCDRIFYTEADFNVHYQVTHAMKVEASERVLREHLVSDHADNAAIKAEVEAVETAYYYECEMCHKIFASEEYFNIHYSKVHGGLLTGLTVSEDAEPGLMEEEQEVPTEETDDYSVGQCDAAAECAEPPPKKPEQVIYFKCDLCKTLYPSEKAYNSHFSKRHGGFQLLEQDLAAEPAPPAPAAFRCEYCPKSFPLRRSLSLHRKRAHAEQLPAAARAASRSKVCDICGRAYNSNAALRYHQRRHTGEKPYPCTMCPKRFTMPMFLQIHVRTHTGEKPYQCQQCPKAFTNKAALIRHDRVHTGIKPYPCPECGKYFTQSNSMKLHVSTVHLKMPAPYKSKNRRNKSEARALQLALKSIPTIDIIEEDVEEDIIDD